MILNYIKSQSSVRPESVDTMSSKTTVYLRRNITEVETENGIMYEYDEAKLTKKEYAKYLDELAITDIHQQRADIDYIALMTGVDLEEV